MATVDERMEQLRLTVEKQKRQRRGAAGLATGKTQSASVNERMENLRQAAARQTQDWTPPKADPVDYLKANPAALSQIGTAVGTQIGQMDQTLEQAKQLEDFKKAQSMAAIQMFKQDPVETSARLFGFYSDSTDQLKKMEEQLQAEANELYRGVSAYTGNEELDRQRWEEYQAVQGRLQQVQSAIQQYNIRAYQEKMAGVIQGFENYRSAEDFAEYAKRGAELVNPSMDEVERGVNLFGWRPFGKDPENIVTYSRDNYAELGLGELNMSNMVGSSLYHFMTDEEVELYNYLLAKDRENGGNESEKYLEAMQEALNYRSGKSWAEGIKNTESPVQKGILYGMTSIGSGVDSAGYGLRQAANAVLGDGERLPTTQAAFMNQAILTDLAEDGKGPGYYAYAAGKSVGNMLPSVAVGMLSKTAGMAMMGISSGGNAYAEALSQGYSKGQALTYGVMEGASEVLLEKLLGGISALRTGTSLSNRILRKVSNIDNTLARIALNGLVSIGSEITEEEVQLVLEPIFRSAIFGEEFEGPSGEEMLETAIVTALSTLALEAGPSISNEIGEKRISNSRAEEILADPQAMAELGVTVTEDMTKAQQRAAVKQAVEALQEAQNQTPGAGEVSVPAQAENAPVGASEAQEAAPARSEAPLAREWRLEHQDAPERTPDVVQRDAQAVREHAGEMDPAGKHVFSTMYNEDQDAAGYLREMQHWYNLGKNSPSPVDNVHANSDVINDYQAQAAVIAGQEDAKNKSTPNVGALTDEDNLIRYRSEVDGAFDGSLESWKNITIGDTPDVLLSLGAAARDLTMTQDTAMKIAYPEGYLKGKHNLGMSALKNLPYQIADPVAVLRSRTQPNSFVLLTEWIDKYNKRVIVPIHLDKQGVLSLENRVASVYGRGDISTLLGANNDNVLYTRNNEDINQLLSSRLQLPETISDDILARKTISQPESESNPQNAVRPDDSVGAAQEQSYYGENTVGAAQSRFEYKEAPTQSVANNMFTDEEAEAHPELVNPTHKVYSNEESRADAAERLALDYEGEKEDLASPGRAWGADDTVAGYTILSDIVNEARESGDFDGRVDEILEWKKVFDEKGTEQGQALQARKQFSDKPAYMVAEAVETLESDKAKRLKKAKKEGIIKTVVEQAEAYDKIASGDTDALIELIKKNNEIRRTTGLFSKKTSKSMDWALREIVKRNPVTSEQFLRDVAVSQIRSIASDYMKTSWVEAVKSYRVMSMLSKMSTVLRNLVSNNIFDPVEALSNNIVIPLDMLLSKITGNRTTTVDKSWASKAKRSGSLDGMLRSYVQVGLDADIDGAKSRYETRSGRTFKMTGNFLTRMLSTFSKYQGYALNSTDEFQKGGIREETQRGIDKLKEQGKLDKDALNDWAQETALQRTFQNDSRGKRAANTIRNGLNEVISIKDRQGGSLGAGDVMMPFTGVPGNLVAQTANYSPLGLANGIKQITQTIIDAKANGGKRYTAEKQAQAVRNVGRGMTGTAMLVGFGMLALKGLIKVSGADDPDKEALEKAQGMNGTQWNLSATLRALQGESIEWQDDDTLMSIGFLEPFNAIMAAGAMIADAYMEDNDLTIGEIAGASASSLVQALLDMPAMSSISELVNNYKYAEGDNEAEKALNMLEKYGTGQLSSFFIPNALRGIATGTDDKVRNQYGSKSLWKNAWSNFKAGVPGARETLPAALDGFGRERTNTGNPVLNFLNSNILPGQVTKFKVTDIEKELERLYAETGSAKVYPSRKSPWYFNVDGERNDLTDEAHEAYNALRGSVSYELVSALMGSSAYKDLSAEVRADMISMAYEQANQIAKEGVSSYFGEDWMKEVPDWSEEKHKEYAALKMQRSTEVLSNLNASQWYLNAPPEVKDKMLANAKKIPNQEARAAVSDYDPDTWVKNLKKAESIDGISEDLYIYLYSSTSGIESLKYKSGKDAGKTITNSQSLLKMEAVYNTPGLNDKQRQAMFEYLGVGKSVIHYNKAKVQEELEKMRRVAE